MHLHVAVRVVNSSHFFQAHLEICPVTFVGNALRLHPVSNGIYRQSTNDVGKISVDTA